ncbi:MAG TPA: hypothetical protein PKL78_11510 [Anaerolineales bacterium]|nr:hypothetical protein [Anaerolineales bacterium]
MTSEPRQEDPVNKFKKLSGNTSPLAKLPKSNSSSPQKQPEKKLDALPKKDATASQPAPAEKMPFASSHDPEPVPVSKKRDYRWAPAFWTIASVLSLTINVVLVIILLLLVANVQRMGVDMNSIKNLKMDVNTIKQASAGLVGLPGGLYHNFEKMERANIHTDVKVEAFIPVQFDLQLNQQTNVVLSQDVTITNALVTVNTGGLNITRANTTIVLPQGTNLPIFLNLTVPVDKQIPISLNIPVDIPLSATELNDPFIGLQEVIKPLYCFLDPKAADLDNQPLTCQ